MSTMIFGFGAFGRFFYQDETETLDSHLETSKKSPIRLNFANLFLGENNIGKCFKFLQKLFTTVTMGLQIVRKMQASFEQYLDQAFDFFSLPLR